jgi:hypothetical protein
MLVVVFVGKEEDQMGWAAQQHGGRTCAPRGAPGIVFLGFLLIFLIFKPAYLTCFAVDQIGGDWEEARVFERASIAANCIQESHQTQPTNVWRPGSRFPLFFLFFPSPCDNFSPLSGTFGRAVLAVYPCQHAKRHDHRLSNGRRQVCDIFIHFW